MAIERSRSFKGHYHVLHGALSPLDGIGPEDLKISPLIKRLEQGGVQEILIATNFTVEGDATALYLAKLDSAPRHQSDPSGIWHPDGQRTRIR